MELLHRRCCGLDVHKATVVACLRLVSDGKVTTEVRTFQTTTADLLRLSEWLAANDCTHVAMEATGVYWKPVWHILDDGDFVLVLANAAHVKNVPGRKTDVNDAMWLAELLAHGLIRASFVPDAQTQEMRNRTLRHSALTQQHHLDALALRGMSFPTQRCFQTPNLLFGAFDHLPLRIKSDQIVRANHTPIRECNSYRHSVFRYRKHSIQSAMETV